MFNNNNDDHNRNKNTVTGIYPWGEVPARSAPR